MFNKKDHLLKGHLVVKDDTASKSEIPVKPSVPESPAIALNCHLNIAIGSLGRYWFYFQHWGVSVSSNHLELSARLVLLTHSEGHQSSPVPVVVILPPLNDLTLPRPGFTLVQLGETSIVQPPLCLLDQVEGGGGGVDEGEELLRGGRHDRGEAALL